MRPYERIRQRNKLADMYRQARERDRARGVLVECPALPRILTGYAVFVIAKSQYRGVEFTEGGERAIHCFVCLPAGNGVWIEINGTAGQIVVQTQQTDDPQRSYREHGYDPIPWNYYEWPKEPLRWWNLATLWEPPNCVTLVKRCLGIRAWWAFTPEQLRRYMVAHGQRATRPEPQAADSLAP